MKTKLLKKWRREANNRIGVFKVENTNQFNVVYCRTVWGFVSDWTPGTLNGYQILEEGIESIEEARDMCDFYRRSYILQEARRDWNEKKYGSKQRYY